MDANESILPINKTHKSDNQPATTLRYIPQKLAQLLDNHKNTSLLAFQQFNRRVERDQRLFGEENRDYQKVYFTAIERPFGEF
jgi:hypothetical protein